MSSILTKLPPGATQVLNLTVINASSQKFYQVYRCDLPGAKYSLITAHGRIGHAAKYLQVLSDAAHGVMLAMVGQIKSAKTKKGYLEQKINQDPVSLLPKGSQKIMKTATLKPLLTLVPGNMTTVNNNPVVKPVKEKPKKPSYNRLLML